MGLPLLVRMRNLLHRLVVNGVRFYYTAVWGMRIGRGSRISLRATLDRSNPRGVVIGEYTAVTFGAAILSHDFINREHKTTRIGSYCFIGTGAVVFPGVTVGDHCIVGVNAVVMRDVPSHSLVMGNPARVIERGIETVAWGLKPKPGETLPGAELLGKAEAGREGEG